MSTPFNAAAAAYGNAAKLMSQAAARPQLDQVASLGQGNDFAKMLADTVQGVMDGGKAADQKAMEVVSGKGDMVDMVTAISQSELAIESMVSVRDRVISAYEEIMKMPI